MLCSLECDASLVCQDAQQDPAGPIIADLPGTCCEPVACPVCNSSGVVQVRDKAGCITSCECGEAISCGANAHYSPCHSPCPPSCESEAQPCITVCVPGCSCDVDFVLVNGSCLPHVCPTIEWVVVDPEDPKVLAAAACGISRISAERAHGETLTIVGVRFGTAQMAASTNYRLSVEATMKNCTEDGQNATACALGSATILDVSLLVCSMSGNSLFKLLPITLHHR
jgi:hypothetical protein